LVKLFLQTGYISFLELSQTCYAVLKYDHRKQSRVLWAIALGSRAFSGKSGSGPKALKLLQKRGGFHWRKTRIWSRGLSPARAIWCWCMNSFATQMVVRENSANEREDALLQ
jgi:hypothetical protein